MPIEGDNLDELLSSFLDGELSDRETAQVQKELESNPGAQVQLDQLRANQVTLKNHFSAQKAPGLSTDFASQVLAKAVQAKSASDESLVAQEKPFEQSSGQTKAWQLWGVVAGVAAALLLAVSLPNLLKNSDGQGPVAVDSGTERNDDESTAIVSNAPGSDSSDSSTTPGVIEPSLDGDPVQYVSEIEFPDLLLVMLADITLSEEVFNSRALESAFLKAGIPVETPILASNELKELVSESRMTVTEEEVTKSDAFIYYLRGPAKDIGSVLETLYQDRDKFEKIAFDLSYHSQRTQILTKLAHSTDRRFRVDQSFAAPVSIGQSRTFDAPLPTRFVSSTKRQEGVGVMGERKQFENLVLYVRVASPEK